MTTNLSRSLGFILATAVAITLAVVVAVWWLIISAVCLAVAAYFWMQDRAYHTIRPRHTTTRPAAIGRDFRLTRRTH